MTIKMKRLNKAQLIVLWSVGIAVSAVLFYAGVREPYLVAKEYEARRRNIYNRGIERLVEALLDTSSMPSDGEWDQAMQEVEKTRAEAKNDKNTWPNYYVGAVLPILILGMCSFITAGVVELVPEEENIEES
ncbi:MAG: hypothetical protein HY709_08820 [Candidatus Latescibacteria bacterium]|nr:hypothetical protein [Candidatus Latescibacterota bacterium]